MNSRLSMPLLVFGKTTKGTKTLKVLITLKSYLFGIFSTITAGCFYTFPRFESGTCYRIENSLPTAFESWFSWKMVSISRYLLIDLHWRISPYITVYVPSKEESILQRATMLSYLIKDHHHRKYRAPHPHDHWQLMVHMQNNLDKFRSLEIVLQHTTTKQWQIKFFLAVGLTIHFSY